MTHEEFKRKYPENRDEMTPEREREFVSDLFDHYEEEGFSDKFWSQSEIFSENVDGFKQYIGQPFTVLGRTQEYPGDPQGAALGNLPMWKIQFGDGAIINAYPDEVIPSEMRDNGCPQRFLERTDLNE